jgi:hypothetical protein
VVLPLVAFALSRIEGLQLVVLQEHSSRRPQRQQVTGILEGSYLQAPLDGNQGCQILSKAGAQLLGAGISFCTPWNSIIRLVEEGQRAEAGMLWLQLQQRGMKTGHLLLVVGLPATGLAPEAACGRTSFSV